MNSAKLLFGFYILVIPFVSCSFSQSLTIENKTYKTTIIGNEFLGFRNQTWMAENLNVSKFQNGDPIPEAKTQEEWIKAGNNKQPAWCYLNNDLKMGAKYGKLYNWYAINDPRQIAPSGWHVPTTKDFEALIDFLDYSSQHLKSLTGWNNYMVNSVSKSGNGDNKYLFNMFPAGSRNYKGFQGVGYWSEFWSSETYKLQAHYSDNTLDIVTEYNQANGYYVRLIKDNLENQEETIQIGHQFWAKKDLDVETFINGDKIKQVRTPEEMTEANKNKEPAWCLINYNSENEGRTGKLYNWYAVNDPRGLAPKGFRIPTEVDVEVLIDLYDNNPSDNLKSEKYWSGGAGNNSSNFSALPCGYVDVWGKPRTLNEGYWWTVTIDEYSGSGKYFIINASDRIDFDDDTTRSFMSVRCIKIQ